MTKTAMEADWKQSGNTVGFRLYARLGIRGIRGEAAAGLPSVSDIGLPLYRSFLAQGLSRNEAGVRTLLHLIARVEDTNMIARGGMEGAKAGAEACARLLEREFTLADVELLDDWFIAQNLSPGGCADLLAAIYFLYGLIS
jgi:holo-ACP synthase/triphosphoribosyl-dephospho-CoA synthase